ncbi:MAG: DNA methyltransferase, partial [Candidatus Sericytochromatia bacterium]|nr:DNA methyltransferase [Candidatus Tanganyikabacteria bacterium]
SRRTRQPQGQGLNDLYVRFFRMAERRIVEQTGRGIVCLISNYSWLDGLSFTAMRERYLEVFDQVWIDNLNGDKYKTGKLTPEGLPDPSIFSTEWNREGIQVGTAIATLVRKQDHADADTVRFRNLWGRNKRADLLATPIPTPEGLFEPTSPQVELGFPFMPMATSAGYFAWPSLPDLLPRSFPGVKTSRDDVVVDIDRDRLVARMERYFDPAVLADQMRRIAPGAMESTSRFPAKAVREALQKRGFLRKNIVRYCYRPFDLRWMYWDIEEALLDRPRPEYFPQVFEGNVWIVSQQKPRREWSRPQVIHSLGCIDLMDRSATCLPLYARESPTQALGESEVHETRPNLTPGAVAYLKALDRAPAEDLFFHIVAVLHAPEYACENAGALRQDWPRVPLPNSRKALEA